MKNEEFNLHNLPIEAQDPTISASDFNFVKRDDKIHDQKFETKPTTFLKDCLKRFCKNKSSVVAAFILGFLLILSVVVPLIGNSSKIHSTNNTDIKYLEPKLFNGKSGFWDGTKIMKDVPIDPTTGMPDPTDYNPNAISDLNVDDEAYTVTPTKFGKDGYVQFGYFDSIPDKKPYISFSTVKTIKEYNFTEGLRLTNFVTYDIAHLEEAEPGQTYPKGYGEAESALFFKFSKGIETYSIQLCDYAKYHNFGENGETIDILAKFNEMSSSFADKIISNPIFEIRVKNAFNHDFSCAMIKSVGIESDSTVTYLDKEAKAEINVKELFESYSFKDGNSCMIRKSKDFGYWRNCDQLSYSKSTHYLPKGILGSFRFDTYEDAFGRKDGYQLSKTEIRDYREWGYIDWYCRVITNSEKKKVVDPTTFRCNILSDECPIINSEATRIKPEDVVLDQKTGDIQYVVASVYKYRVAPYELDTMPKFLVGTDYSGRDMFVYTFEGLRTSLLLGVGSTIVCFLFGLFWGSICGYFGGTVDLIMERFTDILSGIPWIVVMTLVILKAGKPSFGVFALALCLTGWIGTAATTRTQFYRFRGREYVLASRTLGASHGRLIAKHILPNAMGTIITSAVLMVPSVIFEEATLSYLGLAKLGDGDSGLSSLGVILSDNQIELTNHPYLLIFPSIIIALIMISFNLFGNGLRDAVNPSLKGEGE